MSLSEELAFKYGLYGGMAGEDIADVLAVAAIEEALERAAKECEEAKSAHVNLDEKSRGCHQVDADRIRALKDSK